MYYWTQIFHLFCILGHTGTYIVHQTTQYVLYFVLQHISWPPNHLQWGEQLCPHCKTLNNHVVDSGHVAKLTANAMCNVRIAAGVCCGWGQRPQTLPGVRPRSSEILLHRKTLRQLWFHKRCLGWDQDPVGWNRQSTLAPLHSVGAMVWSTPNHSWGGNRAHIYNDEVSLLHFKWKQTNT